MKQKQLLIAFGALVLTACGGSIDLGPKIPAPPITEPEEPEEPVGRQLVPYEIELTTDRDWITKPNYQDPDDVAPDVVFIRSEEHTSELQSRGHLVCRLLLEKKK